MVRANAGAGTDAAPPAPPRSGTNALIPLAQLPTEAREVVGLNGLPPGVAKRLRYHPLWQAAMACEFPTVRVGGRVFVRRSDLPAVLAALGAPPRTVDAA
jgi:hypothetical protein